MKITDQAEKMSFTDKGNGVLHTTLCFYRKKKKTKTSTAKWQLYFAIIANMILLTMLRSYKVKYFAGDFFSQLE